MVLHLLHAYVSIVRDVIAAQFIVDHNDAVVASVD